MEFTAEMIAGLLNGTVVGDKNAAVQKGLTHLSNKSQI